MQCFALQGNLARAGSLCDWKSAPAGARRAPCERLPIRCQQKRRRLTDHASSVSVDAVFHSRHRTAASRANDRTERSRFLFVLFLSDGEKNIFLFFRNQLFFPAHIRTERGGHVHRAVGIQIVFKESDEHSRRGDDRVVERMREIFFAVCAVYADF